MERYRQLFLEESLRHLGAVEDRLTGPEGEGREALDAVFREVHSLKGMAAAMGYAPMAELSHRLEDRLDAWRREGQIPPGGRELCLQVSDRLAEMRDDVAGGGRGDREWADLAAALAAPSAPGGLRVRVLLDPGAAAPAARAYLILSRFRELDPDLSSEPSEAELLAGRGPRVLELILGAETPRDAVEAVYGTLTEVAGLAFPGAEPVAALPAEPEPPPAAPDPPTLRLPETVSAPVRLLDDFVDLLGELTISRSHLEATARTLGSDLLQDEVERLGKTVRSLQDRVMTLRMLPFALITGGLRRLVREHGEKLGKAVELRVAGEEIGLDKSILLRVADPLAHLLRNALDHGLEAPGERRKHGKPELGTVRIEARRARSRVEITVADDGRGVDAEAVRRRAVELGFLREEESRRLTPAELLGYLFRPGFTTRTTVSALSGRGVGLDAVKAGVEGLGGSLQVSSVLGEGTEVRLNLPLSVAVVPVLLVEVGASAVALPTAAILRTAEAQPRDVRRKERGHVLLTERGEVPIVSLARLLRLPGRQQFERLPLVLVYSGRGLAALAVDRFLREEDLFVKPLRSPLRALPGVSGYAVLGDGRLAFLLDPPTLLPA